LRLSKSNASEGDSMEKSMESIRSSLAVVGTAVEAVEMGK
jgi:hypothetical protein